MGVDNEAPAAAANDVIGSTFFFAATGVFCAPVDAGTAAGIVVNEATDKFWGASEERRASPGSAPAVTEIGASNTISLIL